MTPTTALVALCCFLALASTCLSALAFLTALVALGASWQALRSPCTHFSVEPPDDYRDVVPAADPGSVHHPEQPAPAHEPEVVPTPAHEPGAQDWVLNNEELHWSVAPGTWGNLRAALAGMGVAVIPPQDARSYKTYGVFHKGGWVWMSADQHRQHCPRSPIIGVK